MYNLPKGMTFEFLRDRELELLCFGAYTVTLHFEGNIQLQIEGSFTHITKEVKRNGTLSLRFGNGDTLVIDGNGGPYESYNVNHPDGLLVI
jgi:hypothetical protein